MLLEQYRRKWSKEEINALPLREYEGHITLVRTKKDLAKALPILKSQTVLGFDTETKPIFHKGAVHATSLVQLAAEDTVFLIQLSWLPLRAALASVLADAHIIKAGVGIVDDMRELQKLHDFTPAGVVDLGSIARTHKLSTQGLRNLAANFFQYRISKRWQRSDWGKMDLSRKQLCYAATDAWIGREVYLRMHALGMIRE